MLWSKVFDPLIPTDFSAFHAHEILKTFEIRSFFCEKWLVSSYDLGGCFLTASCFYGKSRFSKRVSFAVV